MQTFRDGAERGGGAGFSGLRRFLAIVATAGIACGTLTLSAGAQTPVGPLRAALSCERSEVYVDEVFDLTLTVSALGVNLGKNYELLGFPGTDAMKSDPFRELAAEREMRGSQVLEIRRFQCKARISQPGSVTLSPRLRLGVMVRQRLFIGSTWAESPREIVVSPLTLTVSPLPQAGRPPDFSGGVGRFTFAMDVTPVDVAVGDLVTVSYRIAGDGQLENVPPPQIPPLRNFKVYDPKRVRSAPPNELHFEQIVIPQSTNASAIPPVSFSYFDPYKRAYQRLSRGPFPLMFHAAEQITFTPFRPGDNTVAKPGPDAEDTTSDRHMVGVHGSVQGIGAGRIQSTALMHTRTPLSLAALMASVAGVVLTLALGWIATRLGSRTRGHTRRGAIYGGAAILALLLWAGILRLLLEGPPDSNLPSVVVLQAEPARIAPASSALELFDLKPKTAVDVLETYQGWIKVRHDVNSGWIPAESVRFADATALLN